MIVFTYILCVQCGSISLCTIIPLEQSLEVHLFSYSSDAVSQDDEGSIIEVSWRVSW